MALLPYSKLSSSTSELPEITSSELSKLGKRKYEEIKRYVDIEQNGNKPLFSTIMDKFWSWLKKNKIKKSGEEVNSSTSNIIFIDPSQLEKKLNNVLSDKFVF